MSSKERNTTKCQVLINKLNDMILLDVISDALGNEIFWIHDETEKNIIPEQLYKCKYDFLDEVDSMIQGGLVRADYTNYTEFEDEIEEIHKEFEEEQKELEEEQEE
jgi:hypothetical protein